MNIQVKILNTQLRNTASFTVIKKIRFTFNKYTGIFRSYNTIIRGTGWCTIQTGVDYFLIYSCLRPDCRDSMQSIYIQPPNSMYLLWGSHMCRVLLVGSKCCVQENNYKISFRFFAENYRCPYYTTVANCISFNCMDLSNLCRYLCKNKVGSDLDLVWFWMDLDPVYIGL